jgi:hypothetical protein
VKNQRNPRRHSLAHAFLVVETEKTHVVFVMSPLLVPLCSHACADPIYWFHFINNRTSILLFPNKYQSASGCPGSHIVIRCHDAQLDPAVVEDAAALAARQSKCTGTVIKVSLTRARDIKKPPGAKAGLVQLTGSVRTVVVDMKKAQVRLDRLDKTMLMN